MPINMQIISIFNYPWKIYLACSLDNPKVFFRIVEDAFRLWKIVLSLFSCTRSFLMTWSSVLRLPRHFQKLNFWQVKFTYIFNANKNGRRITTTIFQFLGYQAKFRFFKSIKYFCCYELSKWAHHLAHPVVNQRIFLKKCPKNFMRPHISWCL